jgi:hypothetical protein
LCAIWSADLTRQSLFDALKQRRCYGTTGARIVVRFAVDGQPMGSIIRPKGATVCVGVEVHGTDELQSVEIVTAGNVVRDLSLRRGDDRLSATIDLPAVEGGHYYLRIKQVDGERAWTSPVFFDGPIESGQ